jgi:hypothetical protein
MSPILGIIASQNYPRVTNSYESIATVTVGSGGSSSVTFSSIPSTYQHLQVRCLARSNRASTRDALSIRTNGNTADYSYHNLYGNGATVTSQFTDVEPEIAFNDIAGDSATSGVFGAMIIDVLDYASTTKIKTIRGLGGSDNNGSGIVALNSGAYYTNTNAITSITLLSYGGTALNEYSSFALYGIEG